MPRKIELCILNRWILYYCIFIKPQKNKSVQTHTHKLWLLTHADVHQRCDCRRQSCECPVLSGMTSAPRLLSPGTPSGAQATPTLCVSQNRSGSVLLLLTDLDYRCSLVSSQIPAFEGKVSPSSHSASQQGWRKYSLWPSQWIWMIKPCP